MSQPVDTGMQGSGSQEPNLCEILFDRYPDFMELENLRAIAAAATHPGGREILQIIARSEGWMPDDERMQPFTEKVPKPEHDRRLAKALSEAYKRQMRLAHLAVAHRANLMPEQRDVVRFYYYKLIDPAGAKDLYVKAHPDSDIQERLQAEGSPFKGISETKWIAGDYRMSRDILGRIPGTELFKLIHLYGLSEVFDAAIKRGDTLPIDVRTHYPEWVERNQDFIAKCRQINEPAVQMEHSPDAEVREMAESRYDEYLGKTMAATSLGNQRLYAILTFLNITHSRELPEAESQAYILEKSKPIWPLFSESEKNELISQPWKFLFRLIADEGIGLKPEDGAAMSAHMAPVFDEQVHQSFKAQGLATVNDVPAYALFPVIRLFKFDEVFHAAVARGDVSAHVAQGYEDWLHSNGYDGRTPTADQVAEEKYLESVSRRDAAINDQVRKLHALTTTYYEQSQGRPLTLRPGDLTPAEIQAVVRNPVIELMVYASENDDALSEGDRRNVRSNTKAIFSPFNRGAALTLKNSRLPPNTLYRFVHQFDMLEDFRKALEAGIIPHDLSKGYSGWNGRNEEFVAECMARNSGVPLDLSVEQKETHPETLSGKLDVLLGKVSKVRADLSVSVRRHNKDSANADRPLIDFIRDENNYAEFSEADLVRIMARLKSLYQFETPPEDDPRNTAPAIIEGKRTTIARNMKDAKRAILEKLATPDLFVCLHMYGLAHEFAAADKLIVSPKVRLDYAAWKRRNGELIERWDTHHKTANQLAIHDQLREQARSPEVEQLYTLLSLNLQGHTREQRLATPFCRLVAERHDSFNEQEHGFIVHQLQVWIDREDLSEVAREFWSDVDPEWLFRAVSAYGLEEDMIAARKSGFMPEETALQHWLWKNPSPDHEEPAEEPEAEPVVVTIDEVALSGVSDPRVTYIDYDHDLVVDGGRPLSLGYAPPGEEENDELEVSNDVPVPQDRTEILKKALLQDAASGVRHLTIRRGKRDAADKGRKAIPYNLIDIEMEDGSMSRVVVCDRLGKMTYIHRDAPEWQTTDQLQICNLRKDPKVWQATHFTDEQWVTSIQHSLYTPLAELEIDPKTRNARYGLKGVLIEAFARAVIRTGTLPPTCGMEVVKEEPIAGRMRWGNLYRGANAGAINGLDKRTTWRKLFAEMTKEGSSYTALKEFLQRPCAIRASEVFEACNRFQEEYEYPMQSAFYGDINVNGFSGHAISLAIRFGQVSGLEEYLPEGACPPTDLEDFVVKAGLGQRNGLQLVAV